MFFCLPFTTPPGNPAIAFFLAIRLTSGFISQTSFLYLTWQVYRPCRPFMFALSILCLHSFSFFLPLHLRRDLKKILLFLPNIWYFLALVSTYFILKKKKEAPTPYTFRPKTTCVRLQRVNPCSDRRMNRCTSKTVTPLSLLYLCYSPVTSSIKALRLQDKLKMACRVIGLLDPLELSCIHLERGGNLESARKKKRPVDHFLS